MIEGAALCCETCHRELLVGEWPFCPHGFKGTHGGVIGDECDFVQENGARHPRRFTSKAEFKRWLDANNYENRVEHKTVPGTDKSPHTTDWSKGSMDAVTLENARILTTRTGSAGKTTTPDAPIMGTWTIRELPTR